MYNKEDLINKLCIMMGCEEEDISLEYNEESGYWEAFFLGDIRGVGDCEEEALLSLYEVLEEVAGI